MINSGARVASAPDHFEYFMIRLARWPNGPVEMIGLAELLRTGEKRRFDSGEQLLRLIGEWPAPAFPPPEER